MFSKQANKPLSQELKLFLSQIEERCETLFWIWLTFQNPDDFKNNKYVLQTCDDEQNALAPKQKHYIRLLRVTRFTPAAQRRANWNVELPSPDDL